MFWRHRRHTGAALSDRATWLQTVRQAVEDCRTARVISAEAIIQKTRSLAASNPVAHASSPSAIESVMASQVHVPLPDLRLFNQLMGSSPCRDDAGREAFGACADDASPERQNTQFFA